MTEDGMYGSTLANSLNTNTDVEMSSFKNNTVAYRCGYRLFRFQTLLEYVE